MATKGQIGIVHVIGWSLGFIIPVALASVGWSNAQISKVQDQQTNIVQRIAVVETQSTQYEKDITDINKKLDDLKTLLISQKNGKSN